MAVAPDLDELLCVQIETDTTANPVEPLLISHFPSDRNRTRCVPNCATFPASRSTPATAVAPSATMVSKSVSCLPRRPPSTTARRTHASCAGLFCTVASTRRVSGRRQLNRNHQTKTNSSQEASLKRRVRRNVKAPKAVAGLSYTELLAKKQQKPEVRSQF